MDISQFDLKKTVVFDNISNYKKHRNWIIGDFEPSLLKTKDFEVAVFYINKGQRSDLHVHLECLEVNIIITGECLVNSGGVKHRLSDGDIFTFPKGVKTDVEYTKDTTLVIIKTPSVPDDKHWLKDNEDDEG